MLFREALRTRNIEFVTATVEAIAGGKPHQRGHPLRGKRLEAGPGDLEPDWPLLEEAIWRVLAARISAFEAIRLSRPRPGTTTTTRSTVLGPHPR
jgi:hypothetical protein